MAGISNVKIGGKRAKKDKKGRWTTDKKRWVKKEPKPVPSKVAPVIKLEPKKKEPSKIKELLFGDPLTHGKEDIRMGMPPPIIPAVGAGGLLGAASKAAKPSPATITASVYAHKLIKT